MHRYIVYVVIMESGCKITILYLKLVMKRVYLKKKNLKSLYAGNMLAQSYNF